MYHRVAVVQKNVDHVPADGCTRATLYRGQNLKFPPLRLTTTSKRNKR